MVGASSKTDFTTSPTARGEVKLVPKPSIEPSTRWASFGTFANASPPEDVGGEPGYADFVAAMADRKHPEHRDMLEWYGAPFDPVAFDISAVDLRLHTIKI